MPIGQRGDQRFEKAVSGAYLPRLFWYLAGPEACAKVLFNPYDPETDCGHIIELQDHPVVGEAATAVISRSADLVAAALAGLIKAYQEKEQQVEAKEQQVGIMAEGSLFWEETGGYYERVKETLRLLVADDTKFEILKPPKSDTNKGTPINLTNLVGAACAVLMRNSGET
jgi:hexokinase